MGPILFIIFVNDLPEAIDTFCILFADDTTTLSDGTQAGDNILLNQWFLANKLKLNDTKTKHILFSLDKWAIKSEPVKLLGIHLDTNLSWSPHVDYLCSKLASQVFVIRQLKSCIPTHLLKSVYYSLFHSNLTYGIMLWGNSTSVHKVFVLQKTAIRIIYNAPRNTNCKTIFKKLEILPLPCLYILEVLIETHKNRCVLTKHADVHNYDTRNSKDIVILKSRLKTTKNNKLDVTLYNSFVKYFQHINISDMTRVQFKHFAKSFLLNYCFYTVDEFLEELNTWA